jgi:signal peptidase II
MNENARRETPRSLDIRVGSATNALQPLSRAERPLGAGRSHWIALTIVCVGALAADQLTKWIVSSRLGLGEAVRVIGVLDIHHVRNSGIAFGFFSDAAPVVIILTAIAVAAMLFFFVKGAQRHPLFPVAFGLVLGGSVSNLVDRLRIGKVTDFLDPDYWPAFNLADTFIVLGVAVLFWSLVAADRVSPRVGHTPFSGL